MKRQQAFFYIRTSPRGRTVRRFDITTNAPSYHFYLCDHLGNNRVVMAGYLKCGPAALFYPEIALAVF